MIRGLWGCNTRRDLERDKSRREGGTFIERIRENESEWDGWTDGWIWNGTARGGEDRKIQSRSEKEGGEIERRHKTFFFFSIRRSPNVGSRTVSNAD